ncbi:DUF2867 domain-containing protein [Cellulomonas sp. SLBN-39]|uniref:DUF2867 domain-containing protein n=1 Tax=Cellulomonas sp. SLBN-39 TaxID=2768446 RepID=UPI00117587F9|nr:DUF2867 domain-containing protein [Cellulomonas sp. SLBN-39]TQL02786.1 uncharacterized protein DUF2867 [Cellulomonas sp. SLBN-39]
MSPHPSAPRPSTGDTRRPAVRRPIPQDGLLAGALGRVDDGDVWETPLVADDSRAVDAWHAALVSATPGWVDRLMALRNRLVRMIGIDPVPNGSAGPEAGFPVLARTDDEILLGIDDVHLAFRDSIRVVEAAVRVGTVVEIRNGRGRASWAVVQRIHPLVVRALLRRVPAPVR